MTALTPQILAMYYGGDCLQAIKVPGQEPNFGDVWRIDSRTLFQFDTGLSLVKPILRRLEDMTEEDVCNNFDFQSWMMMRAAHKMKVTFGFKPSEFQYLLSKSFDLFGLIDAKLAIDAKTLEP